MNHSNTFTNDIMNWSFIQSTLPPSDLVVFWLIFIVTLLLFVLKSVKYIVKWKHKKLSTADTIHHLNDILREVMRVLTAKQTQVHVV